MHWRPPRAPPTALRLEDHGPGGEPEPGLVLERRLLLWLPAAIAVAGCRPPRSSLARLEGSGFEREPASSGSDRGHASSGSERGRASSGSDRPPTATINAAPSTTSNAEPSSILAPLDYAAFLVALRPLAAELRRAPARVDAYLHALAALAARLDALPPVPLTPSRSLGSTVEFGEQLREAPLLITQWRLLPGAGLTPHNHPPFAGVTLGLEGARWIRTYALPEGAPRPPSAATFEVRPVAVERCAPGRIVSAIGPVHNVHEFLPAAEAARGVDLYVSLSDDRHFSPLTVDEGPPGDLERPRSARWGS